MWRRNRRSKTRPSPAQARSPARRRAGGHAPARRPWERVEKVFVPCWTKLLTAPIICERVQKLQRRIPMELYFAPLACSMSARIALAEAGADINLVEVDTRVGRIVATGEDYRAVNLLGYVPALRLDDGTVLTENSAILQYIAEQYPDAQLAPPAADRVGRAKLRQWLSFISAELHKGLMTPLLGDKTPPEVKAWTVAKYAPRLAYLDAKLKDREFLLDRFSVADGYLTTVLNWTRATPQIDLAVYPNVKAYLERMRARPSVAAALATEVPLFHAEVARRRAA